MTPRAPERRTGFGIYIPMRRALFLLTVLAIPACHGGSREEPAAPAGAPPSGEPTVTEVSWSRDVWPILIVRCQVCHTTGSGAEQVPDMKMTDAASLYQSWVRIFSQCNPNLFRVYPGRSDLSFVFDKVNHAAPLCGQRMPLLGAPLEDAEQATIRTWIDQGADHN